ncbi:MAG: ATP-dependent Clp protease proteolytic subunit [Candidatus Bathyarchaeia archaeon]
MPEGDPFSFLLWLLIITIFLWPQMKQRALQNARMALIRKMERETSSRIITLIHRQEQIGLFGIPFYRYINIEDSEQVLRAIKTTPPDTPITMILHTPGGLVLAASQIALALKGHPARTSVIVPHYAMSGGALIAMAADELRMDPHAVLGPIDPQLADPMGGALPAVSIIRAIEEKGKENVDDETLIKADIARKALRQMEELVFKLLKDKFGDEQARALAKKFVSGEWTHDYPLTVEELIELGIPVKTDVPQEVYELMELYPQAVQARPSVEFIPSPYRPPGRGQEKQSILL